MKPVDPQIPVRLLPDGAVARVIAETQEQYEDLPSVRTPGGQVITRWELTDEERAAIAAGGDVWVTLFSHGAITPILVLAGHDDFQGREVRMLALARVQRLCEAVYQGRRALADNAHEGRALVRLHYDDWKFLIVWGPEHLPSAVTVDDAVHVFGMRAVHGDAPLGAPRVLALDESS
jgi:hypothetical protein